MRRAVVTFERHNLSSDGGGKCELLLMRRGNVIAITILGAWLASRAWRSRFSFAGKVVLISGGSRGLGVIFNNAGIIEVGPVENMQQEDFERAMSVHFWAPLLLIMEVLPAMRARRCGRIINICSIGGKVAVPHLAPYCASKFALTGLSDALRSELARDNIYVTTVAPGLMRTGSHLNAKFKGQHDIEFTWFCASSGMASSFTS